VHSLLQREGVNRAEGRNEVVPPLVGLKTLEASFRDNETQRGEKPYTREKGRELGCCHGEKEIKYEGAHKAMGSASAKKVSVGGKRKALQDMDT